MHDPGRYQLEDSSGTIPMLRKARLDYGSRSDMDVTAHNGHPSSFGREIQQALDQSLPFVTVWFAPPMITKIILKLPLPGQGIECYLGGIQVQVGNRQAGVDDQVLVLGGIELIQPSEDGVPSVLEAICVGLKPPAICRSGWRSLRRSGTKNATSPRPE